MGDAGLSLKPDPRGRRREPGHPAGSGLVSMRSTQPRSELVEERLLSYLNVLENESSSWVETTQRLLPQVWPSEDFAEWNPPDGRSGPAGTRTGCAI
jgi:hypothetical protein